MPRPLTLAIALAALVAVGASASPSPNSLTELHRSTWDSAKCVSIECQCRGGACCRHAATKVWLEADRAGLDARLVMWRSATRRGVQYGHVVPSVKFGDKWHFFESYRTPTGFLGKRESVGHIPTRRSWYRIFSGRKVSSDPVVLAEPPFSWMLELVGGE